MTREASDFRDVRGPRLWPVQIPDKAARLAEREVDASNPWPWRIEEGIKCIERLQTLKVLDDQTIIVEPAPGARNRF